MLLKHQNGALLIIFLTPFACDNEAIKQNQSQNKNGGQKNEKHRNDRTQP